MSLNFLVIDLRPEAVRLGDVSLHVLPSIAPTRNHPSPRRKRVGVWPSRRRIQAVKYPSH